MNELKEQIFQKAELAIEQFESRAQSPLDYSAESLRAIEEILSEASDFYSELPEEQVGALIYLAGSYILAVAATEFEGSFYWLEQQNQPVFVVGEPNFNIAIATFSKVKGRLSGDSADNVSFFYQGFSERARLARKGDSALYV